MIDMKKTTLILSLALASVAVFCSCSEKAATESADAGESAGMFFKAAKRQGGGSGDLTRLYVAERLQEHDNGEALHCSMTVDLTLSSDGLSWSYSLTDMTAQWYKFAFVSVPDAISYSGDVSGVPVSGTIDGDRMFTSAGTVNTDDCDFNNIVIDYSGVLDAQQASVTLGSRYDLHIYRKIINRWLLPDTDLSEDVRLSPVTGRLVLDMGIPEDQFPEKVSSMTVYIYTPTQMYLRDNSDGSVFIGEESRKSYSFTYRDIPWNTGGHFRISLDLLPSELDGALVTVAYGDGADSFIYRIAGEDSPVSVRSGTKTTVLFNGIEDGFREVRYAGFPDGDAAVDVGDDTWIEE